MATYKCTATTGLLIRGTFRARLKEIAFSTNCIVDIDEDKGWLGSNFRVKFTGSDWDILQVQNAVQAIGANMEGL